jgi:hypothetical protein
MPGGPTVDAAHSAAVRTGAVVGHPACPTTELEGVVDGGAVERRWKQTAGSHASCIIACGFWEPALPAPVGEWDSALARQTE